MAEQQYELRTTEQVRDEVAWAGAGPWTVIDDAVRADVDARGRVFDEWLAAHDAEVRASVQRAPEDTPLAMIASRGKTSTLIDRLLDRANERGIRVQVIEPSVQPPIREPIAGARTIVQALAQHVIDVMEDDDVTARVEADLADVEQVFSAFPEPSPSEVLVEGSYFRTADLPDILGRHMRALDEAGRREKQHWIEHHEPSPSTPSAGPTYHVECLDGCGDFTHHGQPLDWAAREATRHGRDYDGHRANVVEERTPSPEPVSIEDMAPGTSENPGGWPYSPDPANARRCGEAFVGYENGDGSCEYLPDHPGRHWSARWGSWSL